MSNLYIVSLEAAAEGYAEKLTEKIINSGLEPIDTSTKNLIAVTIRGAATAAFMQGWLYAKRTEK